MKMLRQETMPARLEYLQKSLDLVSSCSKDQGFNQGKVYEIELAAKEAIVYIFTYAYNGKDGDVEIAGMLDNNFENEKFSVEIADSGGPLNAVSVAAPDVSADISYVNQWGLGHFS